MRILLMTVALASAPAAAETVARWKTPEAQEGVVVDARHFYALDHRRIVKYDKKTGERVAEWADADGGPIRHFSGGVVVGDRLYATHVTLPEWPVASSIEIFDTRSMRHVGTHSFGAGGGQANWIDRHGGYWWVCFAYYDKHKVIDQDRGTRFTQIVKLDDAWRPLGAWLFDPRLVDEKLAPSSASGGGFGPDDRLYISGNSAAEIYVQSLPSAGSVMRWEATIPIEIAGQHFSWDKSRPGTLYGAKPADGEVTVSDLRAHMPAFKAR